MPSFSFTREELDQLAEAIADRLKAVTSKAPDPKRLYAEEEVAKLLGVSLTFLKRGRRDGFFAAATRKKPILYGDEHIAAVRRWLNSR